MLEPIMRDMTGPARIGCVQHGDFAQTLRAMERGGSQTYQGQFYTVAAMQRFVAGQQSQIICIGATAYRENDPRQERIGLARPGPALLPGRLRERWLARRVIAHLQRFAPTHLVLRVTDLVGCQVLQWANNQGIPSAALIAASFDRANPRCTEFCRLANAPNVAFVANHNRVATQSLVDSGLSAAKALAWDYPPTLQPDQQPLRTLIGGGVPTLLFAGVVSREKGALDLVKAWEMLIHGGRQIKLIICGDGPEQGAVAQRAARSAGLLEAPGRVAQERVVELMRQSDLVVVPSRPSFPEGLPLVIYEALATRTPTLMSDHPVFARYFQEGQGVRFFPAGNPEAISALVEAVLSDPAQYAALSQATAAAWRSIQLEVQFHHVLEMLADRWNLSMQPAVAQGV